MFPWTFRLLAALMILFSMSLLPESWFVAVILTIVGAVILTATSVFEIDPTNKRYREYNSFLMILKIGGWDAYDSIEKLFVGVSNHSQRMHTAHTNHSSLFSNMYYHLFLKLSDGTKVKLFSETKKDKLDKQARELAGFLNCPLEDNV